jgi:membrane-bound inhibitor of C-type lysozyme
VICDTLSVGHDRAGPREGRLPGGAEGLIQLHFPRLSGARTPEMARFVTLASTVGVLMSASPALATEARYTCSDGSKLTANFSPADMAKGSVALTFGTGRELKLPQVLSADGGRYADADIEFWIKGRSATLTMKGVKETCSTQ